MGVEGPLLGRSIPNVDGVALVTGQARYTGDLRPPLLAHGRIVRSPYAHAHVRSVDASAALALEGALELVQVDYQELPVLLDPEAALAPEAPLLHEGLAGVEGNACWRQATRAGDIEAAFQTADLVLRERFRTSKAHAMPMETHAAVAEWDPLDGPTLWTSTQQPHVVRNVAAQVFGLPQSKVRVRKPFVGGAFGHKEGLHTHEAMALLGARRLGRPVRFVLTRTEEFTATVSRNPQVRDVEIALRDDGTVLGWRERIVQDVGAYSGLGPSVLALSEWVTVGPYRTPALDIEGVCVYTNKPPASAFRGFGNPQATFAREVMLDIAARALGTDPFELRRRNLIRQRDLPTRTANGLKLDTLPIEEAMTVAAEAIDLDGLRARLGPFQGIGIANMIEWGGGCRWLDDWDADIGSVTVTLQPDGSAVVASDAADSGQGHATLFTQITADLLGVEPAGVSVVRGDTARAPFGLGTFGSRTSVVQASALHRACGELRERLLRVAANALEAGALVATASYDTPSEVPDANGYGNFAANYTCSATIAVVEVDPATGKIRVLDWSSAEDAGRTLHPDPAQGADPGRHRPGHRLRARRGPAVRLLRHDAQPEHGRLPGPDRARGAADRGEAAHPVQRRPRPSPAQQGDRRERGHPGRRAIANAVNDAIGVPITTLPLTPEKVLEAIDRARRMQ